MGMYTALHFAARLKEDVPNDIINILDCMARGKTEELDKDKLPDHPFFKTSRWEYLFTMSSQYFDYETHCKFWKEDWSDYYKLNVTTNIKNYGGEIEKFLDWIMPYLDKYDDEFIGYKMYEEDDEPTIIKMGRK